MACALVEKSYETLMQKVDQLKWDHGPVLRVEVKQETSSAEALAKDAKTLLDDIDKYLKALLSLCSAKGHALPIEDHDQILNATKQIPFLSDKLPYPEIELLAKHTAASKLPDAAVKTQNAAMGTDVEKLEAGFVTLMERVRKRSKSVFAEGVAGDATTEPHRDSARASVHAASISADGGHKDQSGSLASSHPHRSLPKSAKGRRAAFVTAGFAMSRGMRLRPASMGTQSR